MSEQTADGRRWAGTTFLVVIALLQGAALWWLYDAVKREYWPGRSPAWLIAFVSVALVVPPFLYLLKDFARASRLVPLAAIAALALFGIGWHHGARVIGPASGIVLDGPGWGSAFGYSLAVFVLCIHSLPFVQSWLTTGRPWPAYRDLFEFAWRNVILLGLAVVFCGVFWALLGLWARLFDMIGIAFFEDLFTDSRFVFPATALAFAAGIGFAGSVERLQIAFRQQILALLKWLALLALLILALFSLALVLKSAELFASQQRVISATSLLWLIAFSVYLLNAAYQDGAVERPYPAMIAGTARRVVPLLLVIAIMAAYALIVRVSAYGLTVDRVWGLVVATVALIYAAGYAYAAVRPGPWMQAIGRVNVVAALSLIVLTSLLLTPLLSPYRLAAASQYDRVVSGDEQRDAARAAERAARDGDGRRSRFDLLRFQSGVYGRERLESLAKIEGVPNAGQIRKQAMASLSRKVWYEPDAACPADAAELQLVALPQGGPIDARLRTVLHGLCETDPALACTDAAEPCPVLFADLNADGTAEAIVASATNPVAFARRGDAWLRIQVMVRGRPGAAGATGGTPRRFPGGLDRAELLESARNGDIEIMPPEWNRLRVGGSTLEFRDDP